MIKDLIQKINDEIMKEEIPSLQTALYAALGLNYHEVSPLEFTGKYSVNLNRIDNTSKISDIILLNANGAILPFSISPTKNPLNGEIIPNQYTLAFLLPGSYKEGSLEEYIDLQQTRERSLIEKPEPISFSVDGYMDLEMKIEKGELYVTIKDIRSVKGNYSGELPQKKDMQLDYLPLEKIK